jgi:hypothetical protein
LDPHGVIYRCAIVGYNALTGCYIILIEFQ